MTKSPRPAEDAIEHAPKTAALIAYAEGLLSPDGGRRLEAHLEGCAVCQRELAAIRAYESMVDEAREAEVPTVDFDRMELSLAREAKAVSTRVGRRNAVVRWGPWVVAAAAAAILFVYLGQPGPDPSPSVARPSIPAQPVEAAEPAPVPLHPRVTLAVGETTLTRSGGEPGALSAGAELSELDQIETGADGQAQVWLSEQAAFALGSGSRLTLAATREEEIRLDLESGEVSSHLDGFETSASYVVLAAQYRVVANGTRFAVRVEDLDAPVVAVDVIEGEVRVEMPDGESVTVRAPGRWRSDSEPAPGEPVVAAVRARTLSDELGLLTLPPQRMSRWEVDGLRLETTGPVGLFVERGEHEVRGWDARGRLHTALVNVGETGFLDEGALVAEAPRIRPGHLEADEIQAVVQRGYRNLARCYERALRRPGATIMGRASLRVSIDSLGGVDRVGVSGIEGAGSEEMSTCIQNYVGRWTFPPPGGPLTLSIPVNLAPR